MPSGVTRCTLLMVLYQDRMCQRGLHALGALGAHRYTYAPPRCRTLQCSRTFIASSVSLWNDLSNHVFDGVGLAGSRAGPMLLYLRKLLYPNYSLLLIFPLSLISVFRLVLLVLWGWGLRTDTVYIILSALHCRPFVIIIIIIMSLKQL